MYNKVQVMVMVILLIFLWMNLF